MGREIVHRIQNSLVSGQDHSSNPDGKLGLVQPRQHPRLGVHLVPSFGYMQSPSPSQNPIIVGMDLGSDQRSTSCTSKFYPPSPYVTSGPPCITSYDIDAAVERESERNPNTLPPRRLGSSFSLFPPPPDPRAPDPSNAIATSSRMPRLAQCDPASCPNFESFVVRRFFSPARERRGIPFFVAGASVSNDVESVRATQRRDRMRISGIRPSHRN